MYLLYVESGPRMKTTMVHVPQLLGCLANGKTTEEALEATPDEIRQFLRFLQRHGEDVEPEAALTVEVVQHVMEGTWIGYGDPVPGFEPDFEPLSRKDVTAHVRRLRWLGEDIAAVASRLSEQQLIAKPDKGRPLGEVLRHIAGPEPEYARTAGLGKSEEARDINREIEAGEGDLPGNLARLFEGVAARFEAATDEDLARTFQRGEKLYTAKRGLRRAMEHPWEHLREIERRLASARVLAKARR